MSIYLIFQFTNFTYDHTDLFDNLVNSIAIGMESNEHLVGPSSTFVRFGILKVEQSVLHGLSSAFARPILP